MSEPWTYPDGTRVHHKRYQWMTGTCDGVATDGRQIVLWDQSLTHKQTRLENPADLRPLPVQPKGQ